MLLYLRRVSALPRAPGLIQHPPPLTLTIETITREEIEIITKDKKFLVELSQEHELFLCELKQRLLQDNSLDLTDSDVVGIALDLSIALLNGQNEGD